LSTRGVAGVAGGAVGEAVGEAVGAAVGEEDEDCAKNMSRVGENGQDCGKSVAIHFNNEYKGNGMRRTI